MKFYLKNRKGTFDAIADYDESSKTFTVLKGSCVSENVSNAPTFRGSKSVLKYREKYVIDRRVVENVVFKSPSVAANFVTGRSADGCILWKNIDNHSFKEVIRGD